MQPIHVQRAKQSCRAECFCNRRILKRQLQTETPQTEFCLVQFARGLSSGGTAVASLPLTEVHSEELQHQS